MGSKRERSTVYAANAYPPPLSLLAGFVDIRIDSFECIANFAKNAAQIFQSVTDF